MNPPVVAFCVLVLSLGLTPVVRALLVRRGVMDVPSHRSLHVASTPRGGGVAPAVACLAAVALFPGAFGGLATVLLVAAGGFALLGLADDLAGVPAKTKLVVQLLVAVASAQLLLPDQPATIRLLAGAAVCVWLVSYLNAFNFMDGINGISVAQSVVAGLTWYAVGRLEGSTALSAAGLCVAAAAAGFAPYNFPAARVFLGDAGSYFFGGWLATVAAWGVLAGIAPEAMLGPLLLYLADTSSTLVRRAARGQRLMDAHKEHAYQLLVRAGWSHTRTCLVVTGLLVLCSALGLVSVADPGWPARTAAGISALAATAAYLSGARFVSNRAGAGQELR